MRRERLGVFYFELEAGFGDARVSEVSDILSSRKGCPEEIYEGKYDADIHYPAAIEKFNAILKLGRRKCTLRV